MKRIVVVLVGISGLVAAFAACTHERPPPRMCEAEPPPKKQEEVRISTCPIEWVHDAGAETLDGESGTDAHPDG